MKTAELAGYALDWVVGKAEGHRISIYNTGEIYLVDIPWKDKTRIKWIAPWVPSRAWAQGGPLIEREKIAVVPMAEGWEAQFEDDRIGKVSHGPTPLIAAMRCYAASKLGDEIDVPKELT